MTRYPKATFTPLELGKYADFTKPVFLSFSQSLKKLVRFDLCLTNPSVTVSFDRWAMRVSRSDGLRCDFSTYDINEQYLSIISNPLWGFSNPKRYPQILCGLSSNHVRYPQILCGPCSCDSRFFLVIPYIYSLLRGGFYNASSGFGPEAKTLRGQLLTISYRQWELKQKAKASRDFFQQLFENRSKTYIRTSNKNKINSTSVFSIWIFFWVCNRARHQYCHMNLGVFFNKSF